MSESATTKQAKFSPLRSQQVPVFKEADVKLKRTMRAYEYKQDCQ
jgi:hypothetical protein